MSLDSLSLDIDRARRHTRTLHVLSLYSNGAPVATICDKYQMSRSQVLRLARLAELPKRSKCFDPELRMQVIASARAGLPQKEIAERFAVSVAYVSTAAKAAGLPPRKPQKPPRPRRKQ